MARRSSKTPAGDGGRKDKDDDSTVDAETHDIPAEAPSSEKRESDLTDGDATAEPDAATDADTDAMAPSDKTPEGSAESTTDPEMTDTSSEKPSDEVPGVPEGSSADAETDETRTDGEPDKLIEAEPAENSESETPGDAETAQSEPPEPDPAPVAATAAPVVEQRGPGFVPLVLGGVLAAGIGYAASVFGLLPGIDNGTADAELQAALDRQSEVLAALQSQVEGLGAAPAPEVDLSPVTQGLDALGARIDTAAADISALADRVSVLEERPVFTGDVTQDAAEAAEAVAAMQEQLQAQAEESARLAAEAEAAVAAAAAEAEAAAAAAEEAARARADMAEAEAALESLRLAITAGNPFEGPLADVADVAEVPEALSASAGTGVATLEDLQDRFPAAARAALPVALRETAGDGAMDRLGAFVMGQVGGRSIAPREGDDPDAVLSRAQAAVTEGDLETALDELSALPEGALAELSGWMADARARVEATSALDTVIQSVTETN